MFNITAELDKSSKTPIYEQLYGIIAAEIMSGEVGEGERLPSKKALAAHLGISVNTVETAYGILAQEGLIRSRPRSGYYTCRIEHPKAADTFVSEPPEQPKKQYRADFRTNGVDTSTFPYSTWVRLSKSVMYENPELLNTGDFRGDFELRASIAKYLHEFRGIQCTPSRIVIGAGIEYLLMMLSVLLKGSVIAMENPGYGKTADIFANSGCRINYIPIDASGMSADVLQKTDSDVAYITPSHQFPTGVVMPVSRRIELIAWAREKSERYIIEDDYNGEFNFTIKPIPAVQGLAGGERVIYISTFSRTLAPSVRISYMVLPPELAEAYALKFGRYTCAVPRFEQQTLTRFIDGGYFSRHLSRVKGIYKKRCEAVMGILKRYGYAVSGEKAGLHLLAKVPDAQRLISFCLDRGIRLYKLDDYYFTDEAPSDTVIIGYAGCSEDAPELLDDILNEFSLNI